MNLLSNMFFMNQMLPQFKLFKGSEPSLEALLRHNGIY